MNETETIANSVYDQLNLEEATPVDGRAGRGSILAELLILRQMPVVRIACKVFIDKGVCSTFWLISSKSRIEEGLTLDNDDSLCRK